MVEEKNSSQKNKYQNDINNKQRNESKKKEELLDDYDRILIDTFPASDPVAKY